MNDLLGWGAFLLGIGLGIKWFLGQTNKNIQDQRINTIEEKIKKQNAELKKVEEMTKQKEQSYESAKKNFFDKFSKYISKPK